MVDEWPYVIRPYLLKEWMRNLKIPFLCKLVLQSVNFSVLTRKYSWQVMPLACHATFTVAQSPYKNKGYSTRKTYSTDCSYLLVGLPLPHSFIAKNLRYCHRTTSWTRKKPTRSFLFLYFISVNKSVRESRTQVILCHNSYQAIGCQLSNKCFSKFLSGESFTP